MVTKLVCTAGGGAVTLDGTSPTGWVCKNGNHHGEWVDPNSLSQGGHDPTDGEIPEESRIVPRHQDDHL